VHGTSRAARDEAVNQLLQHCRDTAAWLSPFTHALGASALPRRAHREPLSATTFMQRSFPSSSEHEASDGLLGCFSEGAVVRHVKRVDSAVCMTGFFAQIKSLLRTVWVLRPTFNREVRQVQLMLHMLTHGCLHRQGAARPRSSGRQQSGLMRPGPRQTAPRPAPQRLRPRRTRPRLDGASQARPPPRCCRAACWRARAAPRCCRTMRPPGAPRWGPCPAPPARAASQGELAGSGRRARPAVNQARGCAPGNRASLQHAQRCTLSAAGHGCNLR